MDPTGRKRPKIQDYDPEDMEMVEKEYQGKEELLPEPLEKATLDLLDFELQQHQLNVQEIGRIIAEGIIEKRLDDEILKEYTKKVARTFHTIHDINVWSLADDLNKGTIDSRFVVIGNSFLWNLIKTSMATVRDKFDHYQFKVTSGNPGFSVTKPVELLSNRAREGEFVVLNDSIFAKTDLLNIFNQVAFRKNSDLQSKIKQFCKAYMSVATSPKCAIWYYSLRLSGSSHKKTLQDFPNHVLEIILHFLLALADLRDPELESDWDKLTPGNRFFHSLAPTKEDCIIEFENLKSARDNVIAKMRVCVADSLNECREMPYNAVSRELMPPPRGKNIDQHALTWRQYEAAIKRGQMDPCKENLEAKRELEFRLGLSYHQTHQQDDELDVNITH